MINAKSHSDLYLKSLGLALQEFRNNAGFSQEELGFKCGLDRTYISGIERGERNPSIKSLTALCAPLNLNPSELLSRAEEKLNAI